MIDRVIANPRSPRIGLARSIGTIKTLEQASPMLS